MNLSKKMKYLKSISISSGLIMLIFLLSGCESMGPELGVKRQMQPLLSSEEEEEDQRIFKQLGNPELDKEQDKAVVEEYIGTGKFVSNQKGQEFKVPSDGKYTLNFDGADLREVAKIILSDMLELNYVINPKVRGEVTLQTTRPLTKDELLPTLEMLLRMNNVALVREKDIYRLESASEALQGGEAPRLGKSGQKLPPGYQVRIVPLKYVGVNDMEEILKPIMPPKGILRKDAARNMLMLAGTGRELERLMETIEIFDVNVMEGMSFGLFPLENIDVMDVITELESLFDKEANTPMAGMFKFLPIERLNAVMIITPQVEYLKEIKKWVIRLDRADSVAGEGVIVYRVQHVIATELATTLESVFTGTSASIDKKASLAPGKTAGSISNKRNTTANKQTRVSIKRKPNDQSIMDLSNVQVIADEPNNALVIMARPQQFKTIESIVRQLDVMPLQVLIDAEIFEVSLNDNLDYGMKWKFKNDLPGGYEGIGLFRAAADATLSASTLGGFNYLIGRGTDDIRVLIEMLETTNKVNVVSSPSLLVLNNQEASIQVGDQVPIRTSQSTNTNGGGVNPIQTSNIEMRDTGVTLNITPRVNASGVVIMDIQQSVDNVNTDLDPSGIDSPSISQRKIETSAAVASGETLVLGGLIKEDHTFNNSGIPVLKDLPWIGPFFSTTSKKIDKNELIVLITPTVIANKYDARRVTREFQQKLTGIYEELPRKTEKQEEDVIQSEP